MSRFFHGGLGDSDSSSEEEEELYTESEEEEEEEEASEEESEDEDEAEASDSGSESGGDRFRAGGAYDSDDESDEGKRVVKSAKDKRLEEIEGSAKAIENAKRINDWVTISNEFDKLNRMLAALARSGDQKTPKVYIKTVADLEDDMNEALKKDKSSNKKMSASNAKALNTMKQRLRKNNRTYESDIAKYKADKDTFMVEEEEVVVAPTPKKKAAVDVAISLDDDAGFTTMGKGGKALQYTPESIFKHLRTILEARGKKNTDRVEQIKVMEELLKVAQTDYQRIKVLLTLVSTRFDTTSGISNHMPVEQWKQAETEINKLINILESNTQYVVVESAEEWDDEEKPPAPAPDETFKIPGSIVSLVERLDDELTRALQQIDPHTTDYIDRLQHEQALYTTIFRAQLYFERLQDDLKIPSPEPLNRVVYRRLEHVYFKPASVIQLAEKTVREIVPENRDSKITPKAVSSDATELIKTLCVYLYKHDEASVLRTRAMLCHIYHHAIHNHFYQARDMLLMSHLQEHIHAADINTQVLYNRTLVQIGLCAFRAGLIYEALTALQEICGTGRLKELLAQGVQIQRYSQVTPEQERLERQRQLPFHMHINLELLEAAYLTSSMLLEIPALAATGSSPDLKKRVISKTFRRMLEYHERQIFTGPPENTRDHVMQAAKALAAGEWKKSSELIHAIKIWDLLPEPEATKTMLAAKIQEEGLRTYLFTYAPFYDTISIERLSEMFSLSVRRVSALVSKMIAHEEISAALDNVNKAITFRKGVELSRLQSLALTLSEKASGLIDQNERIFEQRVQVGGEFQGEGRRGGRGGRGGRGRGEGGRGRGDGGRGRGRGQQRKEAA